MNWPTVTSDPILSDEQKTAITVAIKRTIGILAGGPGTGKTTTLAALLRETIRMYGEGCLAAAAPTGKAAVRMGEALRARDVNVRASTIHSLLGVESKDDVDGWGFRHNEENPLPYQFICVDESSMLDTTLIGNLLTAMPKGCSVVFVGDVGQLPPVGHGAPLRDLIAAGVPYGELREIRRNAGTIVRACAEIRDGKRFTADERIDLMSELAKNLKVIDAGRPDAQIAAMLRAIAAAKASGEDPVWGVQVVTAVNAKSKLSRKELNQILQRELNTSGEKAGGNPFLVRDKIVCLKNGFYPVAGKDKDDEQKVFVANGELAEVVQAEEKRTIAKLENPPRVIVIPRGKAKADDEDSSEEDKAGATTGCQWDLGYALSVHKSQGSEWPVVIVMIDDYPGARMVCDRSWLYTAISRAKKLCLLIGKKTTADSFCKRVNIDKRKTFLVERIKEAATP